MPLIDNPLGGLRVEEWIADIPDAPVPPKIRDRIFLRSSGRCRRTGTRITPGMTWDLIHVQPLTAGGEHRESNLAPALVVTVG